MLGKKNCLAADILHMLLVRVSELQDLWSCKNLPWRPWDVIYCRNICVGKFISIASLYVHSVRVTLKVAARNSDPSESLVHGSHSSKGEAWYQTPRLHTSPLPSERETQTLPPGASVWFPSCCGINCFFIWRLPFKLLRIKNTVWNS